MTIRSLVVGAFVYSSLMTTAAWSAETITYTYDALGRLSVTAVSGGPANGVQTTMGFDPAGNRKSYVGVASPVSLSIVNQSAAEGNTLSFTVTRSGSTTAPTSVNYATSNGTAIAASDYTATSGTLTFAIGETSKAISVTTINNNTVEPNETLTVTLSSPTGGATLSRAVAIGTITDNDATYISAGGRLTAGQFWQSPDGRFKLVAQTDFNMVLYQASTPLWATNTVGAGTLGQFVMQGDGNLVLYDSGGVPRWASATYPYSSAVLAIQNDGNVAIYASVGGALLWQTGTCCR